MPTSVLATRTKRLAVIATALLLLASSFTLSPPRSTGTANAAGGVLLGGTPDYLGGPSNIAEKVKLMEQSFGRKADVVRVWHDWDTTFPTPGERTLRDSGHSLFLTVRPEYRSGGLISWRAIANSAPGSAYHNTLVRWAQSVKGYGGKVYINFNHEPELQKSQGHGNSEDFKAAWRKFVQVFRSQGVNNVEYVWVMTDWAFHVPYSDRRAAAKWYPGDGYVDHLAADPFNWNGCRAGHAPKWSDLETQIEPFRKFGQQHPGKGLILAETGSVEDPNNGQRKAQWINNLRNTMKKPSHSQFFMVMYYNQREQSAPRCQWKVDSSTASLNAFRAMARDPFFNGGGGQPTAPSGGAPAPAPRPQPAPYAQPTPSGSVRAPAACHATPTGGRQFKVTWTPSNNDGAVRYIVRRSRNGGTNFWAARTPKSQSYKYNKPSRHGTYRFTVEAHGANGKVSYKRACGGGGWVR